MVTGRARVVQPFGQHETVDHREHQQRQEQRQLQQGGPAILVPNKAPRLPINCQACTTAVQAISSTAQSPTGVKLLAGGGCGARRQAIRPG